MGKRDRIIDALDRLMRRFTDYDSTYDRGYLEDIADAIVFDRAARGESNAV